MAGKRRIDRLRDAGGRMEIGVGDDQSGITEMFAIGNTLHVVKARGIYEVKWPDEIDPGRTNEILPPIQRRILSYGSEDLYVGQVLLTAKALFLGKVLEHVIDPPTALRHAFDCLRNLIALRELSRELETAQEDAERVATEQRTNTGTLALPSIPDLDARVDSMTQKASHSVVSLKELVRLFYGSDISRKWVDSLSALVESRYGSESSFAKFLDRASPVLLLVINTRNSIEHPKAGATVNIRDYTIDKDGQITRPTIEVIHSQTAQTKIDITHLMQGLANHLAAITEVLIANLAACHVQRQAFGVDIFVATIPPERRRFENVAYGYAVQMGNEIVPFHVQ